MNKEYDIETIMNDLTGNKSKSTPIAKVFPEQREISADTKMEIRKTCAVMGCEEYKSLDTNLFFNFPEDSNLRQIWTDLTGRNNWTPNDYSYICVVHFSVDSFLCDEQNQLILTDKAIPSLKLPKHVLEVEYIDDNTEDEEYFHSDTYEMETDDDHDYDDHDYDDHEYDNYEYDDHEDDDTDMYQEDGSVEEDTALLNLFTEVQKMQQEAVDLNKKINVYKKNYKIKKEKLQRLKEIVAIKETLLKQINKKKLDDQLPLLEQIQEERDDLVLAMPTKHTDDLKNFALSVYKYSPQAYIYIRNILRTMLPSSSVLEEWIHSGYQPRNVMSNCNLIKVVSEQTESELSCKICLH